MHCKDFVRKKIISLEFSDLDINIFSTDKATKTERRIIRHQRGAAFEVESFRKVSRTPIDDKVLLSLSGQ